MKMTPTSSTNFVKTSLWVVTFCLLIIAGFIFYYASTKDTTLLGDPYYEDQILAPQRAFIPWAFSLVCVACAVLAGIAHWWSRRKKV